MSTIPKAQEVCTVPQTCPVFNASAQASVLLFNSENSYSPFKTYHAIHPFSTVFQVLGQSQAQGTNAWKVLTLTFQCS